jgi:lipopolysaccharide export system protein LptC
MVQGRRYSRAVWAAKVVLPLVALGLLSLLVLLARSAPEGEPLRFVTGEIGELVERQQLGRARHAAVTDDGGEVTITAERFLPDPTRERVTLGEDVAATLAMPDGAIYDMTALSGELDERAMQSTLRDDVVLVTSEGAVLRTEALRMRNDRTYLESLAPVRIDAEMGFLEAGRMEVFTTPGAERQTRIVFTGGVRLLYTP